MSKTKANTISDVVSGEDMRFMNREHPVKFGWKHAYIAYYEPKKAIDSIIFTRAISFRTRQTELDFAYFVKYGDGTYVFSFRGTDTEDKNFRDAVKTWFSNLDAFPLRKPKDDADAIKMARDAGLLKDGVWGQGTIHDGFYTTWADEFKGWVRSLVCEFDIKAGDTIIFDGHSRGGSLAELAARDMAKNLKISCNCVTAGTPGLGTMAFQREFRTLPITGVRLVNGWDIAVSAAIGFRHGCARKIWFPKAKIFKWLLCARVRDHYQKRYDREVMRG